jgi:Tfp pilus assembly protein PilO
MMDMSRVFAEKRRLILPIAVAAIINLVIYAVVIYPRTSSAGALELRAQQAAAARARAAADLRDAEAIRTGQERAAQQLARFYDSVLPKGQEGARRITYRRLATLADESNLDYDRRTITTRHENESALEHMDVTMVLEGEYRDVRRFIHRLETAPEFVVIADVALVQNEQNAPLTLTVKLSTYYYKAGS